MENWIQKEIDRLRNLHYFIIYQTWDIPEEPLTDDSRMTLFIQYDRPSVEALNIIFKEHDQSPPMAEIEKIALSFLPEFKIKTEEVDFENNDRGIYVDFINQPL